MSLPVQETIPRVQVKPLLRILILALFLPVALAFLADWALSTSPLIVLVTSVICIPLATLLVINRALRDMNALIAVVAPPEVEDLEVDPEQPGAQESIFEPAPETQDHLEQDHLKQDQIATASK